MRRLGNALLPLSFIVVLLGLFLLLGGRWELTIGCIVVAGILAVAGYRLAGGAENPELYAERDLCGLVAYAVKSGNGRIGFHSLRSEDDLVERLRRQGLPISVRAPLRQQIREFLVEDRRAFDACRDVMVIQMVHGGREHFWDGNGTRKTAHWFNQAEIIVDIQSDTEALVQRLFELTEGEELPTR